MSNGIESRAAEKVQVWQQAQVALEPAALLRRVFEAVQAVSWPKTCAGPGGGTSDAVLRTLVTYCYAAGILSSQNIEAACVHDSTVRYICARNFPSWRTIRAFRRRNVPSIRGALEHLFCVLADMSSRFAAHAEAENRVVRAMQADSIDLDD